MRPLTGPVIVTGTDTGVGKTVVTAAIAAAAASAGLRVAVIKPAQTGTDLEEETDAETVTRLASPATVRTISDYPDPLAPLAAARVSSLLPLGLGLVVSEVSAEAAKHDLTLIEGAGGLLVPMGLTPAGEPWHIADLAVELGAPVIVVARAGLGTLNHTALTLEALDRREIPCCVVIGAWPEEPAVVHLTNLADLPGRLVGVVPEGSGGMDGRIFQRSAAGWLAPVLYGTLDDVRSFADEIE
ncbi:dethiobiotin synthetase [Allocatelliglobosispora scoriae]|uniref:ATP-dependent dethiobiotin synthetase BioD n=1 Tax=Allocatelliglobosispora scoriae TaxID=643052 RepID=A0A841BWH3_9ACTN|nr:dethiobiotin synthase [Allocatelliglobosispora scoriae]MBB5872504.1 dethiobiotin synthetase [Allocatelliglobosispora scoriae]